MVALPRSTTKVGGSPVKRRISVPGLRTLNKQILNPRSASASSYKVWERELLEILELYNLHKILDKEPDWLDCCKSIASALGQQVVEDAVKGLKLDWHKCNSHACEVILDSIDLSGRWEELDQKKIVNSEYIHEGIARYDGHTLRHWIKHVAFTYNITDAPTLLLDHDRVLDVAATSDIPEMPTPAVPPMPPPRIPIETIIPPPASTLTLPPRVPIKAIIPPPASALTLPPRVPNGAVVPPSSSAHIV